MKKIVLDCFILILLTSCQNNDGNNLEELPKCIKPIVTTIMEMPIQTPRANIEKYLYENREVYQVNAQNFPDGQSFVYELNCEYICPLGGIDGIDNDCKDYQNAEFIEIIWTDPR